MKQNRRNTGSGLGIIVALSMILSLFGETIDVNASSGSLQENGVKSSSLSTISDFFEQSEDALSLNTLTSDDESDSGIIAGTVSDYLGDTGAYAIYQIPLTSGQYFQAQLTIPNIVGVDYDLYLLDANGDILAAGESISYINGDAGTIPEMLGYIADTDGDYYIYILSAEGGSPIQPYTLDYSISVNYDTFESDESYIESLQIGTLSSTGFTLYSRNLSSPVDNDWYDFTVPSGMGYLIISATTASVNTCKVELYKNRITDGSSGYSMELISASNSLYELTPGEVYSLRVSNALSMEDFDDTDIQLYTLSIKPAQTASTITIDSMSGTEGEKYVTYTAGGRLFRTKVGTITVSGTAYDSNSQPKPNVPVTIKYTNPNYSDGTGWHVVTETGFTDANGHYSIQIYAPQSYGAYSEYVSVSTHYFDICEMRASVTTNSSVTTMKKFYLSAYVIFN